jgi:hypothetical protein
VSNKDVKQDALDNLADALTEDILNTPDDELLREVEGDYGDRRALANKFDQILERAEKQAFGTERLRSSFFDLPYLLLSTLFGKLRPAPAMVWAGAAAVPIVLILGPAVFLSISEFNKRSEQLAAKEKEQLARSEQLAAQEKELLARSEQLAAREEELRPRAAASAAPAEGPQAQAHATESGPSILCETYITEPGGYKRLIEQPPSLICLDDELAFWQNLVKEIYFHKWHYLDKNGQNIFRQGQLDWLRNMSVNCNAEVPVSGTEMARAKSCILQSTKERVAVLSND